MKERIAENGGCNKRLPLWLYSYSSLLISRVSGLFLLVGVKEDNPDDKK